MNLIARRRVAIEGYRLYIESVSEPLNFEDAWLRGVQGYLEDGGAFGDYLMVVTMAMEVI